MPSPQPYNLDPIGTLLIVGLCLALLPLLWVLRKTHHQNTSSVVLSVAPSVVRYRALVLLTLFLTFDLVVFGAFTRLTDSGLGCPDWPGCYGFASPALAQDQIQSAQSAMPSGPVTHRKAWIEMIHRYLATGVGALILIMALWQIWLRRQPSVQAKGEMTASWWPFLTLLWVCMQGAFGALTVTMKLFPLIVTLHLLGGIGLLGMLAVEAQRVGASLPGWGLVTTLTARQRGWTGVGLGLVVMQIALGGWVSSNYAVLACQEVLTCQGELWPVMDFASGFTLWRPLGYTASGGLLALNSLTAIHMTHRLFALLAAAGVLAAISAIWPLRTADQRRPATVLSVLLGLQIATGLSNVVLGWPLIAALLHTAGAAALVVVLVTLLTSRPHHPAPPSYA